MGSNTLKACAISMRGNAGGDTDKFASMTSQIAGAWLGLSQISRELIELLPDSAGIERTAEEFASTISSLA